MLHFTFSVGFYSPQQDQRLFSYVITHGTSNEILDKLELTVFSMGFILFCCLSVFPFTVGLQKWWWGVGNKEYFAYKSLDAHHCEMKTSLAPLVLCFTYVYE